MNISSVDPQHSNKNLQLESQRLAMLSKRQQWMEHLLRVVRCMLRIELPMERQKPLGMAGWYIVMRRRVHRYKPKEMRIGHCKPKEMRIGHCKPKAHLLMEHYTPKANRIPMVHCIPKARCMPPELMVRPNAQLGKKRSLTIRLQSKMHTTIYFQIISRINRTLLICFDPSNPLGKYCFHFTWILSIFRHFLDLWFWCIDSQTIFETVFRWKLLTQRVFILHLNLMLNSHCLKEEDELICQSIGASSFYTQNATKHFFVCLLVTFV